MDGADRRIRKRREGERREFLHEAPDRRQEDRRRATAWALAAVFAFSMIPKGAEAQIYTRRNAKGVVEATNVPSSAGYRLTYPGKGTVYHSRAYRLRRSYNGEHDEHISAAALAYNVSLELVRAVIQVESDFDHLAVSSKGARGLMQLMPATAERFGVRNSFDPRQNIFGGVQYLRVLLDMFGGDIPLVAAAYNAGENAVLRYNGVPPYRETRNYVDKVQSLLAGTAAALSSMASYVPGPALVAGKQNATAPAPGPSLAAAARKARPRPSVFYKWKDASGVVHVGQNPPGGDIEYLTIRTH